MFQSLIGRLVTVWRVRGVVIQSPQFQSLIGRLVTERFAARLPVHIGFQSLIGRLVTRQYLSVWAIRDERFNPL